MSIAINNKKFHFIGTLRKEGGDAARNENNFE